MATQDSTALTWPQLRLLQLIYEPFQYGQWPIFQHVNAVAWHELTSPEREPLEPRVVYYELSARGLVWPPVERARTWQLRDDTVVGITLLGLTHLNRESIDDISNFVNAVRYIGERAYEFRPSSPSTPEQLQITSEEIRLKLGSAQNDRALLRLAQLLRQEPAGMWASFGGPDPGAGWNLTVDTDVARRYRNVTIAHDVFAVRDEIRAAYSPVSVEQPLANVTEDEPATSDSDPRRPRAFVSYSHHDQEFVLALVEEITRQGVAVWIDHVELVVGDSLITRIGDAIHEEDFVIAVISPHSVRSSWCQKELALATTRGINERRVTVLPIRLAEVEMPNFLTDVLYAEGDNPAAIADELAHAIEAHLQRTGVAVTSDAERVPAEGDVPSTAVPETDRSGVGAVLDMAADRVDELLIQWDRCRNAGGATDDLVAEQRRLRTLLERMAVDVQRALPLTTQLAIATWQDYFRVRCSTEVEPDLREELRAVRAQVARGLPVVARWRIVDDPQEISSSGRDATAYLLTIERDGTERPIVVYISGTAMVSSDEHLSADVVSAKNTRGRSVVTNLLGVDDPPPEIMVSTEGVSWDMP